MEKKNEFLDAETPVEEVNETAAEQASEIEKESDTNLRIIQR